MITDFSVRSFFYPVPILRYRAFLRRAERFSREQLVAYQERELRRLVAYAHAHVPYYRRLFKHAGLTPADIRGVADLRHIPLLTKDVLRERALELESDEAPRLGARVTRTSGSTGTPLELYSDRHVAAAKFALFWRIWGWGGYRIGQRWANLTGAVLDDDAAWRHVPAMNALYLSSFQLTQDNVAGMLEELLAYRPRMLRGYPSALYDFIQLAPDRDALRRIGIRSVGTNSETLLAFQREAIEDAFGCKVHDTYSSWEQVCVIAECERQVRHHQMEYGILEVLDENGGPAADGSPGEIVATGLVNRAMPLIRYRTGDLARLSSRRCDCGRAHDVVETIDGRIEDVVVTPDGRRVGRLDAAFKYGKGFEAAQIVQDCTERITVRLVRNDRFCETERAMLENHIRDRVGSSLGIDFEFVDRIEPDANGKKRFMVSRLARGRGDGGSPLASGARP